MNQLRPQTVKGPSLCQSHSQDELESECPYSSQGDELHSLCTDIGPYTHIFKTYCLEFKVTLIMYRRKMKRDPLVSQIRSCPKPQNQAGEKVAQPVPGN